MRAIIFQKNKKTNYIVKNQYAVDVFVLFGGENGAIVWNVYDPGCRGNVELDDGIGNCLPINEAVGNCCSINAGEGKLKTSLYFGR
jgi:hypothetical protein